MKRRCDVQNISSAPYYKSDECVGLRDHHCAGFESFLNFPSYKCHLKLAFFLPITLTFLVFSVSPPVSSSALSVTVLSMEHIEAKVAHTPPVRTQALVFGAQVFLRAFAVATTLAATLLMVTNKQTIQIGGFVLDAKYSYDPAFKFFSLVNIIACVCSALSLLFLFHVSRRGSNPNHYFMLFLHDVLMMSLVLAGCAAATAVGFVAKYGNNHTGWMAVCDQFGRFCKRGTDSMILSYLSVVSLLMLTVISADKSRQIQVLK